MHRLEVPNHLSRRRPQGHDRAGVAVFAEAHPAEIIRCWTRCRQEHEIARGIGDNHGPDVGSTNERCDAVVPCLERGIGGVLGDGIERPLEQPGARIECAHFAARRRQVGIIGHRRARDDEIAHDRGGRCHLVERILVWRCPESRSQIDAAARAEARAGLSRCGIERDQSRIDRRRNDASGARSPRRGAAVAPEAHAAAREVAVAAVRIHARVVAPALRSRRRIERRHDARGGDDIHRTVHHDRRDLERGWPVRHARHVGDAGVIRPGDLQPGDVAARDARERREPRAPRVVAIHGPVAGGSLQASEQQQNQHRFPSR